MPKSKLYWLLPILLLLQQGVRLLEWPFRGKTMHESEIIRRLANVQAWLQYIAHQNEAILDEMETKPLPPEVVRKLAELRASRKALAAALAATASTPTA